MASPRIKVFAVFDGVGAPLTGVTPVFSYYRDDLGGALAAPAITEIGGGLYKFTPNYPVSLNRSAVYMLSTAGNSPKYYFENVRREDYAPEDARQALLGRWVIFTSGPDANRLVMYADDGVTVLQKFDLKDANGNPSTNAPFSRIPTP